MEDVMVNPWSRARENLRYRYCTSNSENFVEHLRSLGVAIGERVTIYEPRSNVIDITRPCLITIGNDVQITHGVVILTHGADWHVLREVYGNPLGSADAVTIEDNVFIGMNSILLAGTVIRRNSIVAAGSVIPGKEVPANSVIGGVPARVLMSIEDYYRKRERSQIEEAVAYANAIYGRYKRLPVREDFKEFFHLFLERDPEKFGGIPVRKQLGRHYDVFMNTTPIFASFEEFLKYCKLPPAEAEVPESEGYEAGVEAGNGSLEVSYGR
jgi:carbonic anhydrase/acetyltransferase-like protein (isoleucine patch superfamily)